MQIEITIRNKEVQINIDQLEIEVQFSSDGAIENITVDGQAPSEIESIVINDNMYEIWEEITAEVINAHQN